MQHVGDVYNYNTNNYPSAEQRNDKTLAKRDRNEAFIQAAKEGHTRRIGRLLELGADLDYAGEHNLTALHHAVLSGFEDTTKALIGFGADMNNISPNFGTPLCLAIMKKRSSVVTLLLEERAIIHLVVENLGTALHFAAWVGDKGIVEDLLAHGANRDFKVEVNLSRFHALSRWCGVDPIRRSKTHFELVRCLDCSPLLLAIYNGRLGPAHQLEGISNRIIPSFAWCQYGNMTVGDTRELPDSELVPESLVICSLLMIAAERGNHMIFVSGSGREQNVNELEDALPLQEKRKWQQEFLDAAGRIRDHRSRQKRALDLIERLSAAAASIYPLSPNMGVINTTLSKERSLQERGFVPGPATESN